MYLYSAHIFISGTSTMQVKLYDASFSWTNAEYLIFNECLYI